MNATLEVVRAGAYASIQDRGRFGFRRMGVPWSGALDHDLMSIANTLVGNPSSHPVIECFDGGQQLRALDAPLRLAVAGHARLERVSADASHPLTAWRSFTLAPGETLRIVAIEPGRIAMVAVAGLEIAEVMSSASTYARAGIGGLHGRALAVEDRMCAIAAPSMSERVLVNPPEPPAKQALRVVPGPQQDYFEADTLAAFFATEYHVGNASDRMGLRLEGTPIVHRGERGAEFVSDASMPGSIQIPGNGQPIVLLADSQTVGGYPKIATIISADVCKLAALRPGEAVRFTPVTAAEGERAARCKANELRASIGRIRACGSQGIDAERLQTLNLIGGVVDARADEQPAPPQRDGSCPVSGTNDAGAGAPETP